ncbi:hypothetical protein F2P81_021986, partial [Scophthalmus maximus]
MTTVSMEPVGVLVERGTNATDPPLNSHEDAAATFTIGTILSIMCLVGVSGNIYTLVVMCQSMRAAASMYIYIINLALADLLYLLTIPFVVCTHFLKGWYFGNTGCRILISMDFLTMHASIFTLTIMSTERYFAVLKPLDTVKRSKSYRKAIALLVWAASLILALPMIVSIQLMTVGNKAMCQSTLSPLSYKVYISCLFCTSIVAPGLIIGYLYTQLARTYWVSQTETFKQTKKLPNQKWKNSLPVMPVNGSGNLINSFPVNTASPFSLSSLVGTWYQNPTGVVDPKERLHKQTGGVTPQSCHFSTQQLQPQQQHYMNRFIVVPITIDKVDDKRKVTKLLRLHFTVHSIKPFTEHSPRQTLPPFHERYFELVFARQLREELRLFLE